MNCDFILFFTRYLFVRLFGSTIIVLVYRKKFLKTCINGPINEFTLVSLKSFLYTLNSRKYMNLNVSSSLYLHIRLKFLFLIHYVHQHEDSKSHYADILSIFFSEKTCYIHVTVYKVVGYFQCKQIV